MTLAVKYIGPHWEEVDNLYGTKARWEQGDVIGIPADIAKRMAKNHPDVYEIVEEEAEPVAMPEAEEEQESDRAAEIRQEISVMTEKSAVKAMINRYIPGYEIPLPKRANLQAHKDLAISLIDRFGVE